MDITLLLEMAADAFGDRVAVGPRSGGLDYATLLDRARRAARWVQDQEVEHLAMIDQNSEAVPVALFAAAVAGVPFVPLNYRLTDDQLAAILPRVEPAVLVVERAAAGRVGGGERLRVVTRDDLLGASATSAPSDAPPGDGEGVAVLLFTSGTTGEPKAAILRHRHLSSYIMSTLEFMGAGEDECALVSVPPYHVAGISVVLSSVYVGRRMVQLAQFDAEAWVHLARDEGVTHAMVVPTMLGRILDVVEREGERAPGVAQPLLRRRADARARHRAGPCPAAPRRLRERLRAHRDELHHRHPLARRPPRRRRQRRPRWCGPGWARWAGLHRRSR